MICYRLIDENRAHHDVSFMARLLGVSRQGYYAWKDRGPSRRHREDAELTEKIRGHHERSHGTYGASRILADLRELDGLRVDRKRVARLMRQAGLAIAGRLGDAQATLVLDDTQVIKKGTRSVGVAHQHCGSTGDVRNCQVMVMLTYAAECGHTFFDRSLYLPAVWAQDAPRRRDAGMPEEITFATKPELGIEMLRGAIGRGLPFGWVAADADYGKDPALRAFLHENALPVRAGGAGQPAGGRPARQVVPARRGQGR
ncbi:transposase [Streptomyces sp. SCSIO 30461]|uniref:IS701 family transposase n=1 Tax=Streptomyces sp. SCSIO 30461 TaxID=3118085 RepID=UPI0030CF7D23